jgi:hypothetical protein
VIDRQRSHFFRKSQFINIVQWTLLSYNECSKYLVNHNRPGLQLVLRHQLFYCILYKTTGFFKLIFRRRIINLCNFSENHTSTSKRLRVHGNWLGLDSGPSSLLPLLRILNLKFFEIGDNDDEEFVFYSLDIFC